MHPVLFEVPGLGFPVRTFGALVACGILLAIWLWGKLLERHGEDPANDPQRASNVAIWVVVGVLAGARLFYVGVESTRYLSADVTEQQADYLAGKRGAAEALSAEQREAADRVRVGHDFLRDPFQILLVWQGGLVMYGGLFGGILLGLWAAKKHGLNPWNALDTGLTSGFFGLVLGRWGCLFVGDDYGAVVEGAAADGWRPVHLANGGEIGPLTIRVPELEWLQANSESLFAPSLAGKVLWATQPWMSVNALVIGLVGIFWLSRRTHYGVPAALLLVHYAVTRFAIESFRGDEVRGVWFGGAVSTSQIVSLGMLVVGVWLFLKRRATPAIQARA